MRGSVNTLYLEEEERKDEKFNLPRNAAFPLRVCMQLCCTKVNEFDPKPLVDHYVLVFEISVCDSLEGHERQSAHDLLENVSRCFLVEPFVPFDATEKIARVSCVSGPPMSVEFGHEMEFVRMVGKVHETYDVLVLQLKWQNRYICQLNYG